MRKFLNLDLYEKLARVAGPALVTKDLKLTTLALLNSPGHFPEGYSKPSVPLAQLELIVYGNYGM